MTVPLSTIKSALRIDYDDDDNELIRLREAAISLISRRTELLLYEQTATMYLANFADTLLPSYPFTSLTSVIYKDASNASITMPATDYWIDKTQGPMFVLRFLEYPAIYEGTAITVTYAAGYATIPNEIVHAVIALTGAWYNNPEASQPISLAVVPFALEYIIEACSVRSGIR